MRDHRPEPILLDCPECSESNLFAEAELVVGRMLPCQHCGAELVLTHDRETPDDPPAWGLELPDDRDEGPRGPT